MALVPVEDALRRALAGIEPVDAGGRPDGSEEIALADALGRVPAGLLRADRSQPPFASSAMDGYAVRAADVGVLPTTLKVIGQSAAGHLFAGKVAAGEAARIFTGAAVPEGADAIVIQEHTRREGDRVSVLEGRPDPAHIRPCGFDFAAGSPLHPEHAPLTARAITLIAASGFPGVRVRRRPRVAILATGDELVAPGGAPLAGQIFASNHLGVAAIVRQAGGAPILLGIARDSEASLAEHLARAADADVLVTIGGASVGDHDLVAPALAAAGFGIDFWKIAMRPGKPLMFGTRGRQRVLGLPGNPVSALICARVFLVPMLRALLGLPGEDAEPERLPAAVPLEANGPRTHYMRAKRRPGAGGPAVAPCANQDSSLLSVLALGADCLIVRPVGAPAVAAGTPVPVLPLDF